MKAPLIATFLLLASLEPALACSVEKLTAEELFSGAAYVVRARIVQVGKHDRASVVHLGDKKFEIKEKIVDGRYKVLEVLKGSPPASGVVSTAEPSVCPDFPTLETGREYVFLLDAKLKPYGAFASFAYDSNDADDRDRLETFRELGRAFNREVQAEVARRASLSPRQSAEESRKASPSKVVQERWEAAEKKAREAAVQKALPIVRAVEKSAAAEGSATIETVLVTQDEAVILYYVDSPASGKGVRKVAIVTKDGKILGGPVDRNEALLSRYLEGKKYRNVTVALREALPESFGVR